MIAKVQSFVLQGVDASPCEIEVDLSPVGLPKTTVVGLPDAAVKESIERVRTALLNGGFRFPQNRITINLAPADVKKEGPVYDLPVAVSLLLADGSIEQNGHLHNAAAADGDGATQRNPEDYLIAGELALDGRIRPIKGAISLAMLARTRGNRGVIVPDANAREAAVVEGVEVIGVSTLNDVAGLFNGGADIQPHPTVPVETLIEQAAAEIDFADIRGQEAAKRAMTIAAAGNHNVLMIGPPGTGKTMMAKALPGVLPPLSPAEALEVTRIYSSVGELPADRAVIVSRPVRCPHHTASAPAIIGGGTIPRPGEVSLAHRGVLFLDELPEFTRHVLETLRQPLEDGHVTVARAQGSVKFPARFMLVAAFNPTPKGTQVTDDISQRAMDRYLSKISGPLIDRIDIHIEVPSIPYKQLTSTKRGTDSATIRERVMRARQVQHPRQGARTNAELPGKVLDKVAVMDDAAKAMLGQAMNELGLSGRAYDKIRRVSRTIADLEGSDIITVNHVAEAVQYRLLDRQV